MLGEEQNALVILLSRAPLTELMRDGLVLAHLGAMAAGFGVALVCDLLIVRRLTRRIRPTDVEVFRWIHMVIARALAMLWFTGVVLVAVATEMDPVNLSPKLAAKMGSVALLTFTAGLMSRVAIPLLAQSVGHSLLSLPIQRKLVLATGAGLSIAGWVSAALLGESGIVKSADAEALVTLLVAIHGGTVLALVTGALTMHGVHLLREVALPRGSGEVRL